MGGSHNSLQTKKEDALHEEDSIARDGFTK